jgi:hypothetical protein
LQTKETGTPEQIVFITAIGIDQQPNIDQLKKFGKRAITPKQLLEEIK